MHSALRHGYIACSVITASMPKRVLDVGNCGPDFAAIQRFCASSTARCCRPTAPATRWPRCGPAASTWCWSTASSTCDYSDGIEVIRQIKADPAVAATPVMLITNYPEHQDAAEALGALRGFGKLEFEKPETLERLAAVLGD